MGKASKWFRQLFGLKKSDPFPPTQNPVPKHPPKRKWSFSKPSSSKQQQQPTHPSPAQPDDEMHAAAVAHATAAVAEAAVAAAHAAAEAVRLTKSNGNKAAHVSSISGRAHVSSSSGGAHVSSSSGRAQVSSSYGGAHVSLGSREERAAAVMIQKHFRGYLSRRALRALKGLVKLQALVRGRIVRKEQIERLQKMQAISRVQTRARALRAQIYESSHSNNVKSSQLHHLGPATPEKSEHAIRKHVVHEQSYMLKRSGSRTNARVIPDKEKARLNYNRDEDSWDHSLYSSKTGLVDDGKSHGIYEIDAGKSFVTSKRRTLFQYSMYPSASDPNSHSFTTSKDSTIHQTILSPSSCEVESFNPITFTDDTDEPLFCTAENSPFYSVSKGNPSTRGPFTPTRSDMSRSCLSGYSDVPNYMSYTESSRAKVRSLSAPRQRTQLERSSTAKRFSINGGYGDLRSSSSQRGSATLQANFTNKAYPGSGRLDRLGLPVGGDDGVGFSGGLWHKY